LLRPSRFSKAPRGLEALDHLPRGHRRIGAIRGRDLCAGIRSVLNTARRRRKAASSPSQKQSPAHNNLSSPVNPVELENMLRRINADGASLAHGWLPFLVIFDDDHFGTQMP